MKLPGDVEAVLSVGPDKLYGVDSGLFYESNDCTGPAHTFPAGNQENPVEMPAPGYTVTSFLAGDGTVYFTSEPRSPRHVGSFRILTTNNCEATDRTYTLGKVDGVTFYPPYQIVTE
ncbi:MAG TPA: hypothetical protein VFC51_12240 [Chloroflexota bacterium]|nr:hypothetical protein [Chloroflexota bacterium]